MSRRSSRQSQEFATRRKGQIMIAVVVVVSLFAAWTMLASSGALDSAFRQKAKKNGTVSVASFNSNSPSKEYIYAAGLLATEEGCGYSISPTSAFFHSAGSEGSVNVSAPTGCTWTVGTLPTWMTLTSADSGSGNGFVSYVVRDNLTGSARQATFTIAGLNFTVVQDGGFANCVYEISPINAVFSSSGGTGIVMVTVDSNCGWQAVSNASWLTVTSGNVGIGNGTVSYSVGANTTGLGRAAKITIGNKTFNVKQKA